ncbi:tRNA (guanosine(37)-N1)-methyltransferase TrmD [Candidatus Microgenomates bacterium]|jgi:tRNA (guanine37-N1)-methyltransferase|nr:MAG: tRNA (guanosine(37)-N1)-methyltransferase TrmD [Candidatus Microgenomates bacterium]
MKIDIITLFPEMFKGPFGESIVKRAQEKSLAEINLHNLRKWTTDKRGTVDDRPYGGGVGMVMMAEPIVKAIEELKTKESLVVLLSPRGKVWQQKKAKEYSQKKHLILICGRYEGIDERVMNFIDEEISIGDYVLTGGEIPAMVLVDSIVRLIPGVLEKPEATQNESFSDSLKLKIKNLSADRQDLKLMLEYPQYTHPEDFRGLKVPKVLLSGNHAEIEKWRKQKALEKTKENRPDLLKNDNS